MCFPLFIIMTRQIKINIEKAEFRELEKIKNLVGFSWEKLILEAIRDYRGDKK